ncbi:MAG: substrate-binding domain-containing protein [Spirochaetes bacterium]|nr:substrate-binding domain-containing protein [Spirochaetota bacterium]
MKTKRTIAVLTVCLLVCAAFVFTGCAKEPKQKTIGFSVFDMQYGFFQQMEKGTREGIEGAGYKYILHDQKGDEAQMIAGCQDLINQGVAALIVSPIKPEVMGPIVEAAHKKKIPVVIDDIGGGGSNYDALVVSNNYEGGQIAGQYAVDQLKGKTKSMEMAVIKVDPSHVFAIRRGEGFKATVEAAGFKVVKELTGHDKAEEGYTVMKDIITSNPKVVAAFGENDPMAAAAAQACADAKRKDIMVIGFNADQVALEAIKAGTMAATVQQLPYDMGKKTAVLADQLIKGQKLTFDDEAKKEIYVAVKLITKDNVEEALAALK